MKSYKNGDIIIWKKTAMWGGYNPVRAMFIKKNGKKSAIINVDKKQKTVRLSSIAKE